MKFIPVPDHIVYDTALSSDEFRLLVLLTAESGPHGYNGAISALCKKAGLKLGETKRLIKDLSEKGRLVPNDKFIVVAEEYKIEIPQPEEVPDILGKRDLFDEESKVISDQAVNHLITSFLKNGLNPEITSDVAKNRFYGNPWSRRGARALLMKHGPIAVEEVMRRLGLRRNEKFYPSTIKSLWTLYEKWDLAQEFLMNEWDKKSKKGVNI